MRRLAVIVKGGAQLATGDALYAVQTNKCETLPLIIVSDKTAYDERMVLV
ncbi:MAG: hypothetical protein V7744_01005 [Pseudomonadales bacterium]